MATPASETLRFTAQQVRDYLTPDIGHSGGQQQFDDALLRAEANAAADQTMKSVIVEIAPPATSKYGTSETLNWTAVQTQQYLRPPGDSMVMQGPLNAALERQQTSATRPPLRVCTVIIQINPP